MDRGGVETSMISKYLAFSLALAGLGVAPQQATAGVFISVHVAPPALPVYAQPVCPGPDYIWTPGYWAWDPNVADYYWVPGTWVMAPQPGYLWTPGYWGFENAVYAFHPGYWGPHIGFYGGVNYGFGYFGSGFSGGYWNGPHFFYNTAISHVNVNIIHNTYVHNVTVVNNVHVSYNGGPGGVPARPTPGEQAAFRENHVAATNVQMSHAQFARQDRSQFASANHGVPPAAALARPAQSVNAFHTGAAPATAAGGQYRPGSGFNNAGGRGVTANGTQGQQGFANNGQPNTPNGSRPDFQQRTPAAPNQPYTPNRQAYDAQQPRNEGRPAYNQQPGVQSRQEPQARQAPDARPAQPRPEAHAGEEHGRR